jgi:hypothetical protein
MKTLFCNHYAHFYEKWEGSGSGSIIVLTEPDVDPGGLYKTYRSYGSGSGTLLIKKNFQSIPRHKVQDTLLNIRGTPYMVLLCP